MPKIAVIGAGINGCHTALELFKAGHKVTIFEEKTDIFQGTSSDFGTQLDRRFNYIGSEEKRKNHQRDCDKFIATYPELLINNSSTVYLLANPGFDHNPIDLNIDEFENICKEDKRDHITNSLTFSNIQRAYGVKRPAIITNDALRKIFKKRLVHSNIKIEYAYPVNNVKRSESNRFQIGNEEFDEIVNATNYLDIQSPPIKLDGMDIVYYVSIGLVFKDKAPDDMSYSFMTGNNSYINLTPYHNDNDLHSTGNYPKCFLTSDEFTIAGYFSYYETAHVLQTKLYNDSTFIDEFVEPNCRNLIKQFWPKFSERFQYTNYRIRIETKIRNCNALPLHCVFKSEVISIISNRLSDIFNVSREIVCLVENKKIIYNRGISIVQDGGFDHVLRNGMTIPHSTPTPHIYQKWLVENIINKTNPYFNKDILVKYNNQTISASKTDDNTAKYTAKL